MDGVGGPARAGAAGVVLDTELVEGLAPEACLARALAAERVVDLGNLVCGFYWWEIKRRAAWVELGHSSLAAMIRSLSHESVRVIEERMITARGIVELPQTRAAFEAGKLQWAAVRALVRVATPETERRWIEWAEGRPTNRVAKHVAGREKGDLPADPARQRIHTPKANRGADLNPGELELFERVRAMVSAVLAREATDRDVIVFTTSVLARLRPDGSIPGWKVVADDPYLLHVKQDAEGRPFVDGHEGEPVLLDPETLASMGRFPFRSREVAAALRPLDASCVELALLDPENAGELVPEEARDVPTPAALRDKTLLRDGHRCRICGSRENLAAHHRRWRSYGGPTALSNLLTACERCHSLVHARLLIVLGDPEGELRLLDRQGRPTGGRATFPVELELVRGPEAERGESAGGAETVPPAVPPAGPGSSAPRVRLEDVVGQDEARDRVAFSIEAARKRGVMPPHTVLCGAPGVGKSFLAEALAGELGAPFVALPAPQVRTCEALVQALAALRPGSVLFMDELHALPRHVAEGVLHQALGEGRVTLALPEGAGPRTRTLELAPFTFLGATTDEDLLPRPLLSRLRREPLGLYSVPTLARLLSRAAARQGLELEAEAATLLAGASRDTPRQGLSLLRDVRDEAAVAGVERVGVALVQRALARRGIDPAGFDAVDRACLRALEEAGGRPVSLRTLAARCGVSEGRVASVHEPFLIRRGLVEVGPSGRVLRGPHSA